MVAVPFSWFQVKSTGIAMLYISGDFRYLKSSVLSDLLTTPFTCTLLTMPTIWVWRLGPRCLLSGTTRSWPNTSSPSNSSSESSRSPAGLESWCSIVYSNVHVVLVCSYGNTLSWDGCWGCWVQPSNKECWTQLIWTIPSFWICNTIERVFTCINNIFQCGLCSTLSGYEYLILRLFSIMYRREGN